MERVGSRLPALRPPVEALPGPALRAIRDRPTSGISRRAMLRRSLAAGLGLWLVEFAGGSIGFAWSAISLVAPRVRVGTLADLLAANRGSADPRRLPGLRSAGAGVRGRRRSDDRGLPARQRRER
jgi:hypothetical protein